MLRNQVELTLNFCNKPIMTCSKTIFLSTNRALSGAEVCSAYNAHTATRQRVEVLTCALSEIDDCPIVQSNEEGFECHLIELDDQFEEGADSRLFDCVNDLCLSAAH